MEWSEVAALIRGYAEAIAEGRIEARHVAEMDDEQLKAFRKERLQSLIDKQKEAEDLANEDAPENS